MTTCPSHTTEFPNNLAILERKITRTNLRPCLGVVVEVRNAVIHARMPFVPIGGFCQIGYPGGRTWTAEVIGARQGVALLSPVQTTEGLTVGTPVRPFSAALSVPVGPALLGRVVDALGKPIDNLGPIECTSSRELRQAAPDPMSRPLIDTPIQTGLRVLDCLCTIGRGQRIGIFGPPGVGKSELLARLTRDCDADVIVLALVGERGREVVEFLDRKLPQSSRERTVIVAATSDRPPLERLYAAYCATTIAEYFRDQGKSVLLVMDSLSRTARALREIGLSAGEAPTRRGYPASVYAVLPQIIERAGRTKQGDITAIYTILQEGDDENDPIAEEVRSLIDGHILLSPAIAAAGRYPAVDVLRSLSRIMPSLVSPSQMATAKKARAALARYAEVELLLQVGEYRRGSDPAADYAIAVKPALEAFMDQGGAAAACSASQGWAQLDRALANSGIEK